jgi:hypothetical protein
MTIQEALKSEITMLQAQYDQAMRTLGNFAKDHNTHPRYSDHAAHNAASVCQELAVLAGKIDQSRRVMLSVLEGHVA